MEGTSQTEVLRKGAQEHRHMGENVGVVIAAIVVAVVVSKKRKN